MTKEELMQLADAYATQMMHAHYHPMMEARSALSDAIDAALAQARRDALEEAAKVVENIGYEQEISQAADVAWECANAIRALKDMYTNPQNLDTSEKRVQIIHDSMREAIHGVITINGKRYATALFGPEGFCAPAGTVLRIENGPDDVVTCTTISRPQTPDIEGYPV